MNYAIILAGGKGVRFEGNIPKQFVELMGEPLLVYSMKTAQENDNVDAICVVSPKEYYDRVRTWADKYHITKLLFVAEAGRERYQSVHSGLKSLPARADDTVIIMTAVCPFVSQLTVDKLYKAMETKDACITVVKATDAITFSNNGESVLRTLQKRNSLSNKGRSCFATVSWSRHTKHICQMRTVQR